MDTGQSLPIKHRDQNLLTYYVHFLKTKLFLSGPVGSWSLSLARSSWEQTSRGKLLPAAEPCRGQGTRRASWPPLKSKRAELHSKSP